MPEWAIADKWPLLAGRLGALASVLTLDRLRHGLVLLLAVWLLSLAADVFWRLMPEPASPAISPAMLAPVQRRAQTATPAAPAETVDVQRMQGWHLFGQQAAEPQAQPDEQPVASEVDLNARETRLQLKLLGVMQSSDSSDGYAIIEHASTAELYRVGDALPAGRSVKLARVLADRVIIDNRGSMESLLLYDEQAGGSSAAVVPAARPASPAAAAQVLDKRNNQQLTQMASNYREQLMQNPMSLADVIKVSIAKDSSGNVIGYSIRPGRDREQFAAFGLQSGDIVTSVNGIPLDDPARAMELYGQLRTATEASFSIRRGSEDLNVIVGLAQ